MAKVTIGWDVGGAHLKAALLDLRGQVLAVAQVPCPLWRGLNYLTAAITQVMTQLLANLSEEYKRDLVASTVVKAAIASGNCQHAITMTGELVDLFEHRQQGVAAISQCMHVQLLGDQWFYVMQANATNACHFIVYADVANHWQHMASANWHASASLLGQSSTTALLIDIGSTTTDFIPLHQGQVCSTALTDAARMQSLTLIYTGVVRTPVMALCQTVMFEGKITTVAAEHFATTADVYRLTGDLNETDDMADTADNEAKTMDASAKRLARMIGHDAVDKPLSAWQALATSFKALQLERLTQVAQRHLKTLESQTPAPVVTIICAGAGRFLAQAIATRLQLPYQDASLLLQANLPLVLSESDKNALNTDSLLHKISVCLPAVAVARLLYQTID